jgi:hypothetical protein
MSVNVTAGDCHRQLSVAESAEIKRRENRRLAAVSCGMQGGNSNCADRQKRGLNANLY